jgi:hypothetical protein
MNIHSFCCTGPDLATDGCYPLCCSLVSGLSYPRKFENQQAIFLVGCKDTFFCGCGGEWVCWWVFGEIFADKKNFNKNI